MYKTTYQHILRRRMRVTGKTSGNFNFVHQQHQRGKCSSTPANNPTIRINNPFQHKIPIIKSINNCNSLYRLALSFKRKFEPCGPTKNQLIHQEQTRSINSYFNQLDLHCPQNDFTTNCQTIV